MHTTFQMSLDTIHLLYDIITEDTEKSETSIQLSVVFKNLFLNETTMKTLIIALNSKYIHSSLAPWYLKASCGDKCGEVKVMEFTINVNTDDILASIYAEKADIAAFSCYIWNIGQILQIAENLKKIQPHIVTVFGGPEVSYDPEALLHKYSFVDFVISGEGEKPFPRLLECLYKKNKESNTSKKLQTGFFIKTPDKLNKIAGLTYRTGRAIVGNPQDLHPDLSDIPSPYSHEMLSAVKDKIIYFEASRGCPFSCSYCLSSNGEGVRFFPVERVKKDLMAIIKAGVRQVKFVDRTFNCNKERAKEILRFISEIHSNLGTHLTNSSSSLINFHFEAAADLFDDDLLKILAEMPKGLVQLEIGIQTVNMESLKAVNRKTDIVKAFENIKMILESGNIHLHLDLIAGLPYEDFESFKESYNRVYCLKPHTLQLGFLKLLKGSSVRENAEQHAYIFRNYPPYEILSNKYISYEELTVLKGIEELLDRYWNSGRFTIALDYIINNYFPSVFDFYLCFYQFNLKMNRNIQSLAGRDLYSLLFEFVKSVEYVDIESFKEYLKLDFLASDSSGHLPAVLDRIALDGFKDKCYDFLKDQNNLIKFLPSFAGVPAKQIMKNVHFELILIAEYQKRIKKEDKAPLVYLFDYTVRDVVTGRYKFFIINFFK